MRIIKKKEQKKKRNWPLSFASVGFSSAFSLSLPLLPSITEKTMAQAFCRFPIISISLKYLRVWQKGRTSFRVDRNLFRSLSNASLTMGSSALLFVSSTYLPNNQPPAFSFSCPTLRPLQRGCYRDTKDPRYRTEQRDVSTFEARYENARRFSANVCRQPRPVDIDLDFLAIHFIYVFHWK